MVIYLGMMLVGCGLDTGQGLQRIDLGPGRKGNEASILRRVPALSWD